MQLLGALFDPRRVLLVGASERIGSIGKLLVKNLESFGGELVCKSGPAPLDDCGEFDLAIIATPGEHVLRITQELSHRVRAIIVLSAGFGETGTQGRDAQANLVHSARPARVIGPNCFGLQDCNRRLNASISAGLPLGGGDVSLVSQAGTYAMAAATHSYDARLRFGKVIALGNASDISASELVAELRNDPETETLCFALESLPDARAFVEEVERTTPSKPVIVYKAGNTDAGARTAASHTGALAAPTTMLRHTLRQAGAVQVDSGEELFDAAQVLDVRPLPNGPRMGVVSNSGGAAVELTDALAGQGLTVPELSDSLRQRIAAKLPTYASSRNPVDITPVWADYSRLYAHLVETLATSKEVDAIVVVLAHRAAEDADAIEAIAQSCQMLRTTQAEVPIYVYAIGRSGVLQALRSLRDTGIPCFDAPHRVARAVAHAYQYGQARRRAGTQLPPLANRLDVQAEDKGIELADLLTRRGIAVAPSWRCSSVDEVADVDVQLPAVVKIAEAEHRTDRDGVRLNIRSRVELHAAAEEMLSRAAGGDVLVQQQIGGVEVIVGALRDPVLGPIVMVGLGGIWVEVFDDIQFALAPIRHDNALALIAQLRAYPLLCGARGTPAVNLDSIADVVVRLAQLCADESSISTITLNPVIATAAGAVAVDWKLTSS